MTERCGCGACRRPTRVAFRSDPCAGGGGTGGAARAFCGRGGREPSLRRNADMGPTEVRRICQLDEEGRALVKAAMQQLGMSARAF